VSSVDSATPLISADPSPWSALDLTAVSRGQDPLWSQAETEESSTDELPNFNRAVYALVVGINVYQRSPEYPILKAAVADADAIESFLLKRLKALPQNIISLRDGEATRQGILSAFSRLEENTAATVNPCIIIYYAGHGAGGPSSDGWETDRHITEQLCPSDLGTVVDGQVVEGIPDRVICALLNSLAKKRGNNIVSPNSFCTNIETRQG
jgi:hypothetical protein